MIDENIVYEKMFYNYHCGFVDFPGKYSITLFFSGCNLNCYYCYNKHVVNSSPNFSLNYIENYLTDVIESSLPGLNVGVVFSGGEPLNNKYFNDTYKHFIERGNPLCIQTNGTIVPTLENYFEYIILSLKTENETNMNNGEYVHLMKEAINYYGNSDNKELRIVDIPKYRSEYKYLVDQLDEDLFKNNFKIQYVDPV